MPNIFVSAWVETTMCIWVKQLLLWVLYLYRCFYFSPKYLNKLINSTLIIQIAVCHLFCARRRRLYVYKQRTIYCGMIEVVIIHQFVTSRGIFLSGNLFVSRCITHDENLICFVAEWVRFVFDTLMPEQNGSQFSGHLNAHYWKTMYEFRFKFHRSPFLGSN